MVPIAIYSRYSFHHILSISWFRDAVPWYPWFTHSEVLQHIFPEAEPTKAVDSMNEGGGWWRSATIPSNMAIYGNGLTENVCVLECFGDLKDTSDGCFEMFVSSVQTSPETEVDREIRLPWPPWPMAHGPSGGTFWWVPGRPWPRQKGSSVQC